MYFNDTIIDMIDLLVCQQSPQDVFNFAWQVSSDGIQF